MEPNVAFALALLMLTPAPVAGGDPAPAAASANSRDDDTLYRNRIAGAAEATRLGAYSPLEAVPGAANVRPLPIASPPTLPAATLDQARDYALANRSRALLIWRDGALERAVYGGGADAASLINAKSMAKPLGAIAIGRAIALGAIRGVDQPAADFITEWRGTPKAAITLRQILTMTSGLAEQGAIGDPASVMTRAYLHPRHDAVMIDAYPLTATPGTRYQYSNVSGDLVALVIERATHRRYAQFVSTEILQPLGAAGGQVWVDRVGGLAHSGCCILLPAETWMRLGLLLLDGGVWKGRHLLPAGYVAQMRTTTTSNPRYGMGLWVEGEYTLHRGFGRPDQAFGSVLHSQAYLAKDLFLFDGNSDQVLYLIPSRRLAILRMGDSPPTSPEWDNAFLPNLILRAIATR